jgi:SAM-dependent methyltransferase
VDPKKIVADGYDAIGDEYAKQVAESDQDDRQRFTRVFVDSLPSGSRVLDLGCGPGVPTTQRLAERFRVTGVDISERQIARARRNVPNATFLHADMASVDFAPDAFDSVVAFFSIVHVPRDEHPSLLRAVARWLRPGGVFVAALGAGGAETDYEEDWMGAPMYWSGFGSEKNKQQVREAGLRLVTAELWSVKFDDEAETWLWVVAEKPESSGRL